MRDSKHFIRQGQTGQPTVYRERTKSRSQEIAEKTTCEEYTLDWSQSKVFLVLDVSCLSDNSIKNFTKVHT